MWRYRMHPRPRSRRSTGGRSAKNAILFLDVQIGKSTLEEELPPLIPFLQRPDVHLGLDPEFAMTKGGRSGASRVGTLRREARELCGRACSPNS